MLQDKVLDLCETDDEDQLPPRLPSSKDHYYGL